MGPFSRFRMNQRQFQRMQRLAPEAVQRILECTAGTGRYFEPSTIHGIAYHGIMQVRHMDANLVRTPGFKLYLHQRVRAVFFQHTVMTYRGFAAAADRHAYALSAMPANRGIDRAARDHHSIYYCQVYAFDRSFLKLLNEFLANSLLFGNHHQS